nr:RNA-directed DNA polymerase, eukaryota [Tanacetum cinerariifolium]
MSRNEAWKEVLDKVLSRLSKWKTKTLSIGGRFTLLKSILGSMLIFHMSIFKVSSYVLKTLESIRSRFFNGQDQKSHKASWVKWDSVFTLRDKGGLGVASLYALNRGLMLKFIWRFYSQKSSLWTRVIKAIHGDDGKLDKDVIVGGQTCCALIVKDARSLKGTGINVVDLIRLKLGNGDSSSFWEDKWYSWSLESEGDYSVAYIHKLIDEKRFQKVGISYRWVKSVPSKVNITAWKIKTNALPTRFNLSRSGMDIDTLTCLVCKGGVETTSHLFFQCVLSKQIMRKVSSWWNVDYIDILPPLSFSSVATFTNIMCSQPLPPPLSSPFAMLMIMALEECGNEKVSRDLRAKVDNLNIKVESGLNETEIEERLSYLKKIEDFDRLKNLDLMRKAKVKWAIKGDENSKYFHGIVNNKFSRSRKNGIFSNGVWLTDPSLVTLGIYEFYKAKFRATTHNRPHFNNTLLKSLPDFESSFLDNPFTCQEIKNAVWDYGGSKAPGPDGFSIKFIPSYWDIIGEDFSGMVKKFEIDGFIPRCLKSAYGSVLVNGSPTRVFKIEKCLRQGEALSPFLFIIAVEALHVSLQEAKSRNLFEGINVGLLEVDISHLQFADDDLVIGKWSIENASNLCRILRCFN